MNKLNYRDPKLVNSPKKNVKVIDILYDGGEHSFSIAKIEWNNKTHSAIRWNVSMQERTDVLKLNGKECIGMPCSRGNPVWFVLPVEFENFIETIIEISKENKP